MPRRNPGLVDIVRDFLAAHQAIRSLSARYRRGELRFEEVQALFSDEETSVLFRLKERCHALFRPGHDSSRVAMRREVLFDLAVGSLFHEAMKFRENFYQREVYGPRVRALRDAAQGEADELFEEFEKILSQVSERLEEGLDETETLLDQTRKQLSVLLAEHRADGHVTRCLLENPELVEEVFAEGLDSLLTEVHGSAAAGYELAGHSYVASGYFEDAERCFAEAVGRGGDAGALAPHLAYARGMKAYLAGDYGSSVSELDRWARGASPSDEGLAALAHTAVSKIDRLAVGKDRDRVVAAASALLERITVLRGGPQRAAAN
jgi:hypothetical protein